MKKETLGKYNIEPFITAKDLREFLPFSYNYILKVTKEGKIPSYKFGGKRLYRVSDIESYLKKQAV